VNTMQIVRKDTVLIDADGLILGRMASQVAKRLLNGEVIVIVNSEKAVLSGKRKSKVAEAKQFLEVGAPKRGPFHYRRPDRIVRKTVRGMLPYPQPKGRNALSRLKVFMGIPLALKGQQLETIEQAKAEKLKGPRLTLLELAKEVGWNGGDM
jgi:large subunit ribosomal protein L13